MSDYLTISLDKVFSKFDVEKSYIILFNIDQIPPHLGLVTSNRYFSLTYDDCQIDDPIRPILTYFKKGKNLCAIIELKEKLSKSNVNEIFDRYKALEDGKTTCLYPIKEVLGLEGRKDIKFVYNLIPELQESNRVESIHSVNFEPFRNSFSIFKYTMKSIQKRIKELNENGKS